MIEFLIEIRKKCPVRVTVKPRCPRPSLSLYCAWENDSSHETRNGASRADRTLGKLTMANKGNTVI